MSTGKYLVVILGVFAMIPLMSGAAHAEDKGLTCPVSGKAIATPGKETTQVLGRTVDLCCPGCESKVTSDLAKYMPAIKKQLLAKGELKQMTCPLTGKPVNAEMTVSYEGMEVGFCCKGCKGKFEKDAAVKEKTLKALPDTLAWFDMCPGSGKAINADIKPISFEVAKGVKQDVYFCCPGCVAPFEKDPAAGVAKLVKKQAAAKKES